MPDRYALFYALFMSEKAGPKKEEFNFNVGTSTCKKYIGTGSMVCALFLHIILEKSRRNISSQISIFEVQTILSCRCCCKRYCICTYMAHWSPFFGPRKNPSAAKVSCGSQERNPCSVCFLTTINVAFCLTTCACNLCNNNN